MAIRILISGGDVVARQGLASILSEESDLEVVGDVNAAAAAATASSLKPDLVILDIGSADANALRVCDDLIEANPHGRIPSVWRKNRQEGWPSLGGAARRRRRASRGSCCRCKVPD